MFPKALRERTSCCNHALTPEERAYIAYCEWCDFLDLTPADLETWRKATKNLSETNYSGLPPRQAKSERAGDRDKS